MKNFFLFIFFITNVFFSSASLLDSLMVNERTSVLIIPYMPAMHLSDADIDLSEGSQMEMPAMRESLRKGIIKAMIL